MQLTLEDEIEVVASDLTIELSGNIDRGGGNFGIAAFSEVPAVECCKAGCRRAVGLSERRVCEHVFCLGEVLEDINLTPKAIFLRKGIALVTPNIVFA